MEKEALGKVYSHSRLWLYENCPEAFKIKYIDKAFPELPKSVEAFLGDIVHQSLEFLYREKIKNVAIELDDLIMKFATLWKENFSDSLRMSNGGNENYYFNKGIKFLIDYYKKNEPFEDNTIEVERKILFPLDEKGEYKIKGFVDRIVKVSDDEYEVHDYKTNDVMKSQEQVDKDRQLAFYHLGLQEIFGKQIRVKLIWHFLAHNKSIFSKREKIELDGLKENTLDLIKEIEETKEWVSCNKRWCDWCNYKKQNGIDLKDKVWKLNNYKLNKYL